MMGGGGSERDLRGKAGEVPEVLLSNCWHHLMWPGLLWPIRGLPDSLCNGRGWNGRGKAE